MNVKKIRLKLKRNLPAGLAVFALFGCTDLFSTREDQVEKPDPQTTSAVYEEPTSPDNVLVNLSRAIKQQNIEKYLENFAKPEDNPQKRFRFIGDANFIGQLPDNWSYSDERNYFSNITSKDPFIRFSYADSVPAYRPINPSALNDSVDTDFFRYELQIEYRDTTEFYTGLARFKLYKSDFLAKESWYIYYWEDRALNGEFEKTWTNLKFQNQ